MHNPNYNPLTDTIMVSIPKNDLLPVCKGLILGIRDRAADWDNGFIGAGTKNNDVCKDLHAMTQLLCQCHNKLRNNS
jgi:hypothetical protein